VLFALLRRVPIITNPVVEAVGQSQPGPAPILQAEETVVEGLERRDFNSQQLSRSRCVQSVCAPPAGSRDWSHAVDAGGFLGKQIVRNSGLTPRTVQESWLMPCLPSAAISSALDRAG